MLLSIGDSGIQPYNLSYPHKEGLLTLEPCV